MLKIKSIFTSLAIAVATLVGLAPSANAVATATAPISVTAYSGATNFIVNDVPSIAAGSFKLKITNVSDANIYREIYPTFSGSGTFSISLDILALESSISVNPQVANVTTTNGNDALIARLPNGVYNVEFSYRDFVNFAQLTTINVAAVSFNGATSLCTAGEFSSTGLSSATCVSSPAGKYTPAPGYTEALPCEVGTFQDLLGQSFCKLAEPGHYVDTSNQTSQIACPIGNYQPNAQSRTCILSPPNFFVSSTGQSAATACPVGATSAPGSTGPSACLGAILDTSTPLGSETPAAVTTPAVKALPTLAKGKKMNIKTLARQIEMSIPAKAKVSAKVAKSSKKICKVSGTSIKALKPGACVVTVKVQPKKGSATTKATTITVR